MTCERTASAILHPENWTQRLVLADVFDSQGQLDIDLGCGKGRFLTVRAGKQPDRNFLGIDRLLARLRKVNAKIAREGLTNVRLLRIEAAYAVEFLLPEQSVSTFYILFPDPWPKRRHHRRRLFTPPFMDALHRSLTPDGRVYVATDHLSYYEKIHGLLAGDSRFHEIPAFEPTEDERTEFETLFLQQNKPIGRCGFEKLAVQADRTAL